MAARAAVLKEVAAPKPHPCLNSAVSYTYGGATISTKGATEGGVAPACAAAAEAALHADKACAPAPASQCGFDGAWGGGGGDGTASYYVSSYFWDRAVQAGAVPENALVAPSTPRAFGDAADAACAAAPGALAEALPGAPTGVDDAALFCLDLSYCHTLLTRGFGLEDDAPLTLVKQVMYKGDAVEAAWPLGAAINALGATPPASR